MKEHYARRIEIRVNNAEKTYFSACASVSRFAYNWGLAHRRDLYKNNENNKNNKNNKNNSGNNRYTSAISQHNDIRKLKHSTHPWLKEYSKWIPQNALIDLEKAYTNYYRERAKGNFKQGLPKFKKKYRSKDSFRIDSGIKLQSKYIKLPKMKKLVRLNEDTSGLEGRLKSATISRHADRWYISLNFLIEVEDPIAESCKTIIGVDAGLKSLLCLSTGEIIENPKPLKTGLRKLKRLSKSHSRKLKGSKNRKKACTKLAKLHKSVSDQRTNYLHQTTTRIAKNQGILVLEDLKIENMIKNRNLSQSIQDAAWYEIRRQFQYKIVKSAGILILADTFFPSTKLCSDCGNKQDMPLGKRVFVCGECGMEKDRDQNSADNLLDYGIVVVRSTKTLNACGEILRPEDLTLNLEEIVGLILDLKHGRAVSLKQEKSRKQGY